MVYVRASLFRYALLARKNVSIITLNFKAIRLLDQYNLVEFTLSFSLTSCILDNTKLSFWVDVSVLNTLDDTSYRTCHKPP